MKGYADLIAEARETSGLIVGELLQALEETLTREAELDHSVADAMEQIEAIQGTSQVHIDRVADLGRELRILQLKYDSALADVARNASDQRGEGDS